MTMFFVLLWFLLGLSLGIAAGLIPGLHPNTVLTLSVAFSFLGGLGPLGALAFVVSMSMGNSVMNFIPSIFIGAPEPDSCLSVLPGHRMLMEGRGYDALRLTVIGGLGVCGLTAAALPFLLWALPAVYQCTKGYMLWLLLAVVGLLFAQEGRGRLPATAAIFIVSGITGWLLLQSFPEEDVLFPAFTGLFGIPVALSGVARRASFPKQKKAGKARCKWLKGTVAGWLAGLFVGILPGIGPAQAGVLASRALRGNEKDFLVALGGIGSANMVFTFIALHSLGKTRSGAAWALSQAMGSVTLWEVAFAVAIALVSCVISSLFALRAGKMFLSAMERADYRKLNVAVLGFMAVLVAALAGPGGLLIASACTLIGLACGRLGVKKMHMMGFLMLPTMLYFAGAA